MKVAKPVPVSITLAAAEEIRKILNDKGIPPDYFLRVGTTGGGCAGVSFIIGFDKQTATDELYHIDGINVLIDKRQAMFLWGVIVDFVDGLERGFTLSNENVPRVNP